MFACRKANLHLLATVALCLGNATVKHANAQLPCVRLTETVLDESTRIPLAGARVTATFSRADRAPMMVRTDSAGRATFCIAPDETVSIRIDYGDLNTTWRTSLTPGKDTNHTSAIHAPLSFVRGRVIDDATGRGVAQAAVRIANTKMQALSDADGRFVFEQLPSGTFTMVVEHIAYTGHRTHLNVGRDDLDATIRVAAQVIPLEPIVVTAFSRQLEMAGFYDRRKRGVGTFIDRKRIDQMNVQAASDLLRAVPGVRLVPQARTRTNQLRNATVGGRGNCRYVFVVDGARTLSDFEMDYIAGPAIEGVEIYSGMADVPAAFKAHATSVAGSTVCGVIAIWTRNSR